MASYDGFASVAQSIFKSPEIALKSFDRLITRSCIEFIGKIYKSEKKILNTYIDGRSPAS